MPLLVFLYVYLATVNVCLAFKLSMPEISEGSDFFLVIGIAVVLSIFSVEKEHKPSARAYFFIFLPVLIVLAAGVALFHLLLPSVFREPWDGAIGTTFGLLIAGPCVYVRRNREAIAKMKLETDRRTLREVRLKLENNEPELALDLLNQMRCTSELLPEFYVYRSGANESLGNMDQATMDAVSAVTTGEDSDLAWHHLGMLHLRKGELEKAEAALFGAYLCKSTSVELLEMVKSELANCGRLIKRNGDPNRTAIARLNAILEMPNNTGKRTDALCRFEQIHVGRIGWDTGTLSQEMANEIVHLLESDVGKNPANRVWLFRLLGFCQRTERLVSFVLRAIANKNETTHIRHLAFGVIKALAQEYVPILVIKHKGDPCASIRLEIALAKTELSMEQLKEELEDIRRGPIEDRSTAEAIDWRLHDVLMGRPVRQRIYERKVCPTTDRINEILTIIDGKERADALNRFECELSKSGTRQLPQETTNWIKALLEIDLGREPTNQICLSRLLSLSQPPLESNLPNQEHASSA